jgi:hypothetical protein
MCSKLTKNVKSVTLLTCTWNIKYPCSQHNWPKMSNMWLYWHVHETLHIPAPKKTDQICQICDSTDMCMKHCIFLLPTKLTKMSNMWLYWHVHEALHIPAPNKTDEKCQICDSTDMCMKHYIFLFPTKLTKNVKYVTLLTCAWNITYSCSKQNWPKMSNMWLYWHVHEALHTPAPNKTDQKCQICDSTDMYMKHYIYLLPKTF